MAAPANRRADPSADALRASPPTAARRIRFVAEPAAGATIIRRFTRPRPCAAVSEALDLPSPPPRPPWPETTDHLDVLVVPANDRQDRSLWLTPPDHADAAPAVTVELGGVTVDWRPGRAVVTGPADRHADALAALTDVAF